MKHFGLKQIGKKLIALSMAAAASVTMMLSIAPATANAGDPTVYTSQDEFIPLSAPIYNWKNSNKVLRFKVKLAYNYTGGADFALMDKDGNYSTNFLSFKPKQGTVSYGGTLTDLTGSGTMRWYQCSIEVNKLSNFGYSKGTSFYLSPAQEKRQTLYYLYNLGHGTYKDFEVLENVDPDRSVNRFHVNQLNLNMTNMTQPNPDSVPMWKYSSKKIIFDFKATNDHYYGNDNFSINMQTITDDGHWYKIANTITVNAVTGATTLPGATVNSLGGGWYHIELPLNKFTPYYGQVSNPGSRTLDVIGFDWVNHSFLMRDFRVV